MSIKFVEEAPAKVNFYLDILGRRPDGIHDLKMVNHRITLSDKIILIPDDHFELESPGLDVSEEENLITKAVKLLSDFTGRETDFIIKLEKNIPVQAGLGGGSSDAAATLLLLNRYWKLGLSIEELHPFAEELGSDVTYCLYHSPAIVTGRGEKIEPVHLNLPGYLLLIGSDVNISTPDAYSWVDEEKEIYHPDYEKMFESSYKNSFYPPVSRRYPEITDRLRRLESTTDITAMSGTGPTVVGYYDTETERDLAAGLFKNEKILKAEILEQP